MKTFSTTLVCNGRFISAKEAIVDDVFNIGVDRLENKMTTTDTMPRLQNRISSMQKDKSPVREIFQLQFRHMLGKNAPNVTLACTFVKYTVLWWPFRWDCYVELRFGTCPCR